MQTFGYALETLRLPSGPGSWGASEEEIELAARTRVERQQQILYDKSKRIRVVLLEGVLHTRLYSPSTMYGQLDRLLSLDGLPSLELGTPPSGWPRC